ncbi:hypothetical protein CRG98_013700 [Punica granatum]|uniref:Uncharacterized protein n=1 Tax=Punica granatum TaxID=22663 RepID=A0A2I0KBN3_PUNGR|nr:hypothetical protein CRG98_013700 [Punica granatum]
MHRRRAKYAGARAGARKCRRARGRARAAWRARGPRGRSRGWRWRVTIHPRGRSLSRWWEGGAAAGCERAEAWRVEPRLGVEPWLGGLAWLSCGSSRGLVCPWVPVGPFWGVVCLSVERAPRALSEKASVRDQGFSTYVACPGNAPGRVVGHFGTKRDFWSPILGTFRCFGDSMMNSAAVPALLFLGFFACKFFRLLSSAFLADPALLPLFMTPCPPVCLRFPDDE